MNELAGFENLNKTLGAVGESFKEVGKSVDGMGATISGSLNPGLSRLSEITNSIVRFFKDFWLRGLIVLGFFGQLTGALSQVKGGLLALAKAQAAYRIILKRGYAVIYDSQKPLLEVTRTFRSINSELKGVLLMGLKLQLPQIIGKLKPLLLGLVAFAKVIVALVVFITILSRVGKGLVWAFNNTLGRLRIFQSAVTDASRMLSKMAKAAEPFSHIADKLMAEDEALAKREKETRGGFVGLTEMWKGLSTTEPIEQKQLSEMERIREAVDEQNTRTQQYNKYMKQIAEEAVKQKPAGGLTMTKRFGEVDKTHGTLYYFWQTVTGGKDSVWGF